MRGLIAIAVLLCQHLVLPGFFIVFLPLNVYWCFYFASHWRLMMLINFHVRIVHPDVLMWSLTNCPICP